ncbi:hypothetical protein EC973_000432 [Apophysomyces ossiformis]|uniref:Cyclin-domain-containing protein n=1 Tax=Apophysomyces ossiformis TaxID=679940 RepID=A0A8H7BRN8_9FUNG|nr:hypothetical protein EC973_000432 [Apophysomyces ossiformis]
MSPCPNLHSSSVSLLSCTNTAQLADFCASLVPNIWAGPYKPFIHAKRHAAFKLFCQKILKATQISSTCVVLALYYIYRLRSTYPSIQGSMGSEVRLFTTALVLANKFLDDNTFTNKTWSDVSSIPVHELNIMEVEFLSALNYRIYVRQGPFFAWVMQCQQWLSLATQTKNMSLSTSMPNLASSLKRRSCAEPDCYQPSAKRIQLRRVDACPPTPRYMPLHHHHPTYTPSLSSISSSCSSSSLSPSSTLLMTNTPTVTSSSAAAAAAAAAAVLAAANTSCYSTGPSHCRPILSWSSSATALASSHHATTLPLSYPVSAHSMAAAAATAVQANHSAMLCARVKCLEIE